MTGNGPTELITFTAGDGNMEQDAKTPRRYTRKVAPGASYYSISAQTQGCNRVSCQIDDENGAVLSSAGTPLERAYSIVQCSTSRYLDRSTAAVRADD